MPGCFLASGRGKGDKEGYVGLGATLGKGHGRREADIRRNLVNVKSWYSCCLICSFCTQESEAWGGREGGWQLGLEVAFGAPGLRAEGRWAPGVEGQLPVLMDCGEVWGKGEQRSGREKGDRVSQTSCPGIVTRGKGVLTQNPTDLGWQEPWGLRAASAAP